MMMHGTVRNVNTWYLVSYLQVGHTGIAHRSVVVDLTFQAKFLRCARTANRAFPSTTTSWHTNQVEPQVEPRDVFFKKALTVYFLMSR